MIRRSTYITNRIKFRREYRKITELAAEINRTKAQLKKEVEQRKEAEELLEASKRECLRVFAGGIAHDFNNLMTVVLGSITLSRMLIDDEHEVQEILDEAENAVKQARSITMQLLAYARNGESPILNPEADRSIKDASVLALNASHGQAATVSGEESIFQVHIPTSHGPATATVPGDKAPHPNKQRILVMDDDKQVLNTVHSMLTLMGHDVVLAADGKEAISIYREALMAGKGFAAVIMDLTIPGGMGGLEAMQHLLVIDPEVKAIVSSGYSDEMVMEDYRKWGFKGTVPKPYTIKELSDVLNNIIGQ